MGSAAAASRRLDVELNEAVPRRAVGGARARARSGATWPASMTPAICCGSRRRSPFVRTADEPTRDETLSARGRGGGRGRARRARRDATRKGATCAPTSMRGGAASASCSSGRRAADRGMEGCARGSPSGEELRADAPGRRGADRAGDRQVRRPLRHHRGSRCGSAAHLEHWRALSDSPGAVRPEAGLPAAGDEPRGQHRRFEGRGAGASRRSSSSLKAELEKMREQVQNVE